MCATNDQSNVGSPAIIPQEVEATEQQTNPSVVEKIEEMKLMSKYPTGMRAPDGQSAFLKKRLRKGQKFFDSGDYEMAKQMDGGEKKISANKVTTGAIIPTPETVPARKTPIVPPCNKLN